ncbi:MAG: flagellar basal body-associated protein FliL [Gammaproteobacteria bacterium]|nr:flagellar basal body-associated protein FliL [Gammaproteobacteria bacterium]MBU2058414.1 flagellar basal body-associated protein FliL [Gammaproteobacteria bacterium]MBU2176533.1 flagellar basal body-associated protein FliL [Gammaproteobacteria bacterium]MBU2248525.1 flagellar basal body-associated protein FliL [Gammaproteobacteria bacterium]MBU2345612.1 flagellar basal body-associated protein FliL [Gammaproteobacteria bacterium]
MAAGKDLEIGDGKAKKKKLLIIIAAAVVLAIGAVVAVLMMSGGSSEPAPAAAGAESVVVTDPNAMAAKGTALYVSMPRPFIFNVPGASKDRLVQIKVQLLVRGSNNEETAKVHIPLIESTLLRNFSTSNAEELITVEGKENLKKKALKDVQEALTGVAGSEVVEEVLFTGFVMQ